jgi:hypothetical protein
MTESLALQQMSFAEASNVLVIGNPYATTEAIQSVLATIRDKVPLGHALLEQLDRLQQGIHTGSNRLFLGLVFFWKHLVFFLL